MPSQVSIYFYYILSLGKVGTTDYVFSEQDKDIVVTVA